jgi:hypothetical protein
MREITRKVRSDSRTPTTGGLSFTSASVIEHIRETAKGFWIVGGSYLKGRV